MAKMVIDKKTGKKRAVNVKASKAAKAGARKRKKGPMSAARRKAISLGVRRARKTGKTAAGRKTKWKKAKGGTKKKGSSTKKSSSKKKKANNPAPKYPKHSIFPIKGYKQTSRGWFKPAGKTKKK